MPIGIVDQLVHMTVRIECDGGRSSGTGFIFNFSMHGTGGVPAIVTNKHVIAGAQNGVFHMTVADNGATKYGSQVRVVLNDFEQHWVKHPNPDVDLAAFPIATILQAGRREGTHLFYRAPTKDLLADTAFMEGLNAIEDIVMVGYPNGLWDTKNNLPMVRRGVTATPPYIDFEGRPEFMIDCACFPGSSGSPVLLFNNGGFFNKDGSIALGGRVKLLGILWGGPQCLAPGVIRAVPIPTAAQELAGSRIPINPGVLRQGRTAPRV